VRDSTLLQWLTGFYYQSVFSHLLSCPRSLHSMLFQLAASSCCRFVNELVTGLILSPPHCEHGTGYWQNWSCCSQPLLSNGKFPSPAENIFVPVCLSTPVYRLVIVSWCAPSLPLVGTNTKVTVIVTITVSKLVDWDYCSIVSYCAN